VKSLPFSFTLGMIGDPRRAEGKLYQLPDWSGIATPSDCAYGPDESDQVILGLPYLFQSQMASRRRISPDRRAPFLSAFVQAPDVMAGLVPATTIILASRLSLSRSPSQTRPSQTRRPQLRVLQIAFAYIDGADTSQPTRFRSPPSLSNVWPTLGAVWFSGVTVTF
jgi:hypothetical protein